MRPTEFRRPQIKNDSKALFRNIDTKILIDACLKETGLNNKTTINACLTSFYNSNHKIEDPYLYLYTDITKASFTMSFTKTTSENFTTIVNGVDNRIQIIQHKETGFYNITKMAKLVNNLIVEDKKLENNDVARILATSDKRDSRHWFANTDTKILIDACLEETGLEYVQYELKKGTPTRFAGTYVHRYLYDHFMSWLDKKYAMKVSIILDKLHQDATRKAIDDAIKPKDDEISELKEMLRKQDIKIDTQTAKMDKLIGYARDTKDSLDDVKDDLEETKEIARNTMEHLTDKSLVSTMNPDDESKHHNFAVSRLVKIDGTIILKLISGQRSYVNDTINEYIDDGYDIVIPITYNANGIDLRQNCSKEFTKFRKEHLKEFNLAKKQEVEQFNNALEEEIKQYNRKHPNNKRIFENECHKYVRVLIKDIHIKWNKCTIEYVDNECITFDDCIDLIKRVNHITQTNPLSESDDE